MLGPWMIALADRNLLSLQMARDFHATGAHSLSRASAAFKLKPLDVLADGTYLED